MCYDEVGAGVCGCEQDLSSSAYRMTVTYHTRGRHIPVDARDVAEQLARLSVSIAYPIASRTSTHLHPYPASHPFDSAVCQLATSTKAHLLQ